MNTPKYCFPDPIDEMTFASLHIAAVRTNIHVHEAHPCQRCLADVAYLGQHGFALTTMIHDLRGRIADLEHALAQAGSSPAGLPGWEELAVSWVSDDDEGSDLITVVDTRTSPHRPVLELPPANALGLAIDITTQARDALMGGAS